MVKLLQLKQRTVIWILSIITFICFILFLHNKPFSDTDTTHILHLEADFHTQHEIPADYSIHPPLQIWLYDQYKMTLASLGLIYTPPNNWPGCRTKFLTYYFPNINTIFTGIPKSGTTNWKAALLFAEGALGENGELKPSHVMSNVYRFTRLGPALHDGTLNDAFSFAVIRNPWTRLVSGYFDKMLNKSKGDYRAMSKSVVRLVRGITNATLLEDLYPTLEEFLQWILIRKRRPLDRHFIAQHTILCLPAATYDYIVPLEYAGVMGHEIWDNIGTNLTLHGAYDESKDPRNSSTSLKARELLAKVDPSIVERIYDKFKADFTLANYTNFTHPNFPLPSYFQTHNLTK